MAKKITNIGKNTLRFEYRDPKSGKIADLFWGIDGDETRNERGIITGPADVVTVEDDVYKLLLAQVPFAQLIDQNQLVVK